MRRTVLPLAREPAIKEHGPTPMVTMRMGAGMGATSVFEAP